MPRSYSRRRVLLAVGAVGTTPVTGCLDRLTQSASDSRTLSISGTESGHTAREFRAYVDRIRDQYESHGVWGIQNADEGEQSADSSEQLTFVGAWSDQWVLGSPAEDEGIHVPVDVAGVLYRVADDGEQQKQLHRLWLWIAATPTQLDDGAGSTTLTTLSVGVDLESGVLESYSPTTSIGHDDGSVRIGLDNPPAPTARRRLPAGRIQPDPDETTEGENGAFAPTWSGGHGDTISVAGVCELRQPDGDYELTVTSTASASQGTL